MTEEYHFNKKTNDYSKKNLNKIIINNKNKRKRSTKKELKKKNSVTKDRRETLESTIGKMRHAIENQIIFTKKVFLTNDDDVLEINEFKNINYSDIFESNKFEEPEETVIYYYMTKFLGEGTFGAVTKINTLSPVQMHRLCNNLSVDTRQTEGGIVMAYKRTFEPALHKHREISILRRLNHPNIIKLYAYSYSSVKDENETDLYNGRFANLFMEFIPYSLSTYLNHFSETLQWSDFKNMFKQTLEGLAYLHYRGICHRDIKPQNIMVTRDLKVKICDFGSAKLLGSKGNNTYVITRNYRSPENLLGNKFYSTLVDIWSAGVVFLETFYFIASAKKYDNCVKFPIFTGNNSEEILIDIIKKLNPSKIDLRYMKVPIHLENRALDIISFPNFEFYMEKQNSIFPSYLGAEDLNEVFKNCIKFSTRKRSEADELLQMSFFRKR